MARIRVWIAVDIRPIRPDDLDGLREWYGPDRDASFKESLDRHTKGDIVYLVAATSSGRVVGHLGIDLVARSDAVYIWQMGVEPALQSLGIGTAMLAEAETIARGRGFAEAEIQAETSNPRARALYERLGFRSVGMDTRHDEWILRKTL